MKKLLCLVLALLMVLSMAACGEDPQENGETKDPGNQNPGTTGNIPTTAAPTEPSVEDLGPWVISQETDHANDRFVYAYDENGNLTGYEAFDGSKKYRDYQAIYSDTASGGKLLVIESKHVQDKEFKKTFEMEYDADGKLIRCSNYTFGDDVSSEYLFTYDQNGYLSRYVYTYEGMLGDQVTRVVNYTFENGLLTAVEQTVQVEGEAVQKENAYAYQYDEEGYLKRIDYNRYDVEESGTILLVKDVHIGYTDLVVAEGGDNEDVGRTLFRIEEETDSDGKICKFIVTLKRWHFTQEFAIPYFLFGMPNSSAWDSCYGTITFVRLDTYLAGQA